MNGSNIEFDRSGGGWTQHWSGQLGNDGGRLRIVNGSWTGTYVERYPGQNNWNAEKKK
ncbi:MAG TPA: hypothetical protein VNA26_03240 [Chitinophagaceae bacterium]|nr:hypothetical protein [Chitinophagaceae bacterium]